MKYELIEPTRELWEAFIAKHQEANFLSSWAMGEVSVIAGKKPIRLMVVEKNSPKGAESVVAVVRGSIITARRGRYIEVGGGPILDWANLELVKFVRAQLKQICKQEKAVFVRIRPQAIKNDAIVAEIRSVGFTKAPMHLYAEHTSILDITRPYDDIKLAMRKKTRYEINQASKQGIRVETSTTQAVFDDFLLLQVETAKRQGFGMPPLAGLRHEFEALNQAGLVTIYSAFKDDMLLAQAMIIRYNNEADYLYGASTLDGRDYPGSYAIQDRVIIDSQAAGCTRYNLWGTSPADKPDHRFAQITTFKNGFGGGDYLYVPAHDLVVNKLLYVRSFVIETARRKRRKL